MSHQRARKDAAHFGVEHRKIGEHPHVGTLKTKTSLQEGNELVGVASILVEADEGLKGSRGQHSSPTKPLTNCHETYGELFSVYNKIETTNLSEAELLLVNAGSVDLLPNSASGKTTSVRDPAWARQKRAHWVFPAFRAASTAA